MEKTSFSSIDNYDSDVKEVFSDILTAAGVSSINDPKVDKLITKVVDLISKYRQLSYQEGWRDGNKYALTNLPK